MGVEDITLHTHCHCTPSCTHTPLTSAATPAHTCLHLCLCTLHTFALRQRGVSWRRGALGAPYTAFGVWHVALRAWRRAFWWWRRRGVWHGISSAPKACMAVAMNLARRARVNAWAWRRALPARNGARQTARARGRQTSAAAHMRCG